MPELTTTLFSGLNIQTFLIGLVVFLIFRKIRHRLKYKLPPGPFALPILGNYEVMQAKFKHEVFNKYKSRYGPVFQVHLGTTRAVVLNSIKVVNEALITRKADFAGRPVTTSIKMMTKGGKDIVFGNYSPTWKLQKKIAGKAMRQYMAGTHLQNVIHKSATKCLNLMAAEPGPFDPAAYIDLMIFNIVDALVFGESAELDDKEFQDIIKSMKEVNDLFGKFFIEDIIPLLAKIRPTEHYQRAEKRLNELLEIFQRKYRHHQNTIDKECLRDFTDALILASKEAEHKENEYLTSKLSETHLQLILSDIFMAGTDTTRVTICFALRYMASLPHIQAKVQEEIDRVVGRERMPGLNDKEKLPYGEATIYEVLRLSTISPTGVPHTTICDTTVGGYDIPKDTMVFINHWAMHHDPNYWRDAETFDPGRFLDENGKLAIKSESWFPFSVGRRVCLGEAVAKQELHLVLSSILQRFTISLAAGTNPEIEVVGNSDFVEPAGFKIVVSERK